MTPLEAEMVVTLWDIPPQNQSATLAKMFNMDEKEVWNILDDIMRRGLISPRKYDDSREGYKFWRKEAHILHDATMINPGYTDLKYPKIYDLWNDWVHHDQGARLAYRHMSRTDANRMHRIQPCYQAILEHPADADQISQMQPWEDMRSFIKMSADAGPIGVAFCACRRRVSGGGFTCRRTKDHVCLVTGRAVEFNSKFRHGREIGYDEALAINNQAELDGLLHCVPNSQEIRPAIGCNCCDCCCHHWEPILQFGWTPYDRFNRSRWLPQVDHGVCDGCVSAKKDYPEPKCVHACQFYAYGAIEMKDPMGIEESKQVGVAVGEKRAHINEDKCAGCLSCALNCEVNAITVKCVRPVDYVQKEEWDPFHNPAEYPL